MIDEGAVGDTWIPFSRAVIVVIQPKHTARLETCFQSQLSFRQLEKMNWDCLNEPFNRANRVKMCSFCRSAKR